MNMYMYMYINVHTTVWLFSLVLCAGGAVFLSSRHHTESQGT